MLDVSLRDADGVNLTFAKSTHTAVIGDGVSQLLRLIAGDVRPESGSIFIGAREVTKLSRARRPLLYATREIDAPHRWSVRHLLVAAVRQRTLDRVDRQHEFDLAVAQWALTDVLDRPLRTLSSTERNRANLARIELLKPAILVADRLIDHAPLADPFYRTLRVLGTTVINAPSSTAELGFTDRVVVLDEHTIVQEGTFAEVYRHPATIGAATATGRANLIPITVRGNAVDSPIGSWEIAKPPFEGEGIAIARPEEFTHVAKGEESDLIFSVEEAAFQGDHWRATGILTGNLTLEVRLPRDVDIHKGRLLALRYDASRFTLLRRGTHFAASETFRYSLS